MHQSKSMDRSGIWVKCSVIQWELILRFRPDITIRYKRDLYVIELTVPYETICIIARRRKQEKYRVLRSQLLAPCDRFKAITLEVTTLGFVTKSI
jgi:hypothetical protein